MESSKPATLIRIHRTDNVGVLSRSVAEGEPITFDGREIIAKADTALGHKFAFDDIAKGDKIFKYGISIGSATEGIPAGGHVHLHNLQSDYLPTFTLDDERNFAG